MLTYFIDGMKVSFEWDNIEDTLIWGEEKYCKCQNDRILKWVDDNWYRKLMPDLLKYRKEQERDFMINNL